MSGKSAEINADDAENVPKCRMVLQNRRSERCCLACTEPPPESCSRRCGCDSPVLRIAVNLCEGLRCGTICTHDFRAGTRRDVSIRSVGAAEAQVPYTHKVTSSNLVPTTTTTRKPPHGGFRGCVGGTTALGASERGLPQWLGRLAQKSPGTAVPGPILSPES